MSFKTLTKNISINASAETVWNTLFSENTYKIWSSVFSEGSYFKTDWKEGSKVIFGDLEGYGLIGQIVENNPNTKLKIKYTGQLVKGVEDYTTPIVLNQIKDSTEIYTLVSNGEQTELKVELMMFKVEWACVASIYFS